MYKTNEKYGSELIDNGFLKYANPKKIDSLKSEIIDSFYIYNEDVYRFAHVDAEELAEFSFDFFLPALDTILKHRNVNISVEKTGDYKTTNDIIINGERINLYKKQEVDNLTFWDAASRNFFEKVNEILKYKKMDEKFYLLYGGNDLSAILLTDKQFKIVKEYYKGRPKEIPYLP